MIARKEKADKTFTMRLTKEEKNLMDSTTKLLNFLSKKEFIIFSIEVARQLGEKAQEGHKIYYGNRSEDKLFEVGIDFFGADTPEDYSSHKLLDLDTIMPIIR